MPVRSLSARSFFDPEFVCPSCLVPGSLAWVLAKHRSTWFPAWLFADWRGTGRRGRDAWPAVVLVTLVLLRWSEDGLSRRAAIRRAATDVVWRAAMGLQLGTDTPSEKTLRDFECYLRKRYADTQTPRYLLLHEHIVRACLRTGVADARTMKPAIDSTPMWCYGAVRDTVRLLGDGLQMLAREWAGATRTALTSVADAWGMPFLMAKSTKGAFDVNWHDPSARAAVVAELAGLVTKAAGLVRRDIHEVRSSFRKALLRKCRNLLRVVTNDLEKDEGGRLVIARKVAADRLISITDPEARHGRKSKSQTFNGFKLHLLGEVVSGLILSVAVTQGNEHDGVPADRLIRRAKDLCAQIERILGDTAYGGARLRHIVRGASQVQLLCPPVPVTGKDGVISKSDFDIDFENRKATCANGVTSTEARFVWTSEHQMHSELYVWPKEACDVCPLSKRCRGKATGGRRLLLHPYEQELRAARDAWAEVATKTEYRSRSQCERLVNQMTRHGGRKARAFGLAAAQVQAHAIAASINLRLLGQALTSTKSPTAVAA